MRALQIVSWKTPPQIRDVPDPEPGPGEVVIKVAGAGACHSDLHLLHDFDEAVVPFRLPFTLGHENTGWVHQLGAGVRHLEIGEPVAVYGPWGCGMCARCRQGMENYCERQAELGAAGGGLGLDGGMAPFMRVPSARWLVPLGDLNPIDAAPLTDAGLTPYHAVKRSLGFLTPGSHAVVIGVGGLGHLGVQVLRAVSAARVIAVDTREDALRLADKSGAEATVLMSDSSAAEILEFTKGKGADVVLDMVGVESTIALATSVARPLSHVTLVGIGGGSYPFSFFTVPYEASMTTTYWGSLPELIEVIALAQAGHIRPTVARFGLDEAPGVYDQLAAGKISGRAVITPNG